MRIRRPAHHHQSPRTAGPGVGLPSCGAWTARTASHGVEPKPWSPLDMLEALSRRQAELEGHDGQPEYRWPADCMPLGLWVAENPDWPELQQDIMLAARQWSAASAGQIAFELSLSEAQADIAIDWSDETTLGRDYEVGHAHRQTWGRWIHQARITLIRHPVIDTRLSPEQRKRRLFATLLHELGHALGLEHSEHQADVMYYRGWQRTVLSHNDIARLQQRYAKRDLLLG